MAAAAQNDNVQLEKVNSPLSISRCGEPPKLEIELSWNDAARRQMMSGFYGNDPALPDMRTALDDSHRRAAESGNWPWMKRPADIPPTGELVSCTSSDPGDNLGQFTDNARDVLAKLIDFTKTLTKASENTVHLATSGKIHDSTEARAMMSASNKKAKNRRSRSSAEECEVSEPTWADQATFLADLSRCTIERVLAEIEAYISTMKHHLRLPLIEEHSPNDSDTTENSPTLPIASVSFMNLMQSVGLLSHPWWGGEKMRETMNVMSRRLEEERIHRINMTNSQKHREREDAYWSKNLQVDPKGVMGVKVMDCSTLLTTIRGAVDLGECTEKLLIALNGADLMTASDSTHQDGLRFRNAVIKSRADYLLNTVKLHRTPAPGNETLRDVLARMESEVSEYDDFQRSNGRVWQKRVKMEAAAKAAHHALVQSEELAEDSARVLPTILQRRATAETDGSDQDDLYFVSARTTFNEKIDPVDESEWQQVVQGRFKDAREVFVEEDDDEAASRRSGGLRIGRNVHRGMSKNKRFEHFYSPTGQRQSRSHLYTTVLDRYWGKRLSFNTVSSSKQNLPPLHLLRNPAAESGSEWKNAALPEKQAWDVEWMRKLPQEVKDGLREIAREWTDKSDTPIGPSVGELAEPGPSETDGRQQENLLQAHPVTEENEWDGQAMGRDRSNWARWELGYRLGDFAYQNATRKGIHPRFADSDLTEIYLMTIGSKIRSWII